LVVKLCAGGLWSRWGDEGLFKSSRKTEGPEFLSEVEGWTSEGPGVGVLDMESGLSFLSFLSLLAIELVVGTEDDLR
jgi:hypothetical protein